jgi:hypothetical protein
MAPLVPAAAARHAGLSCPALWGRSWWYYFVPGHVSGESSRPDRGEEVSIVLVPGGELEGM